MKRYLRNLAVWTAWRLGWMDVPWWDDARIGDFEEEEPVPTVSGEPLRAALAAREARTAA